MKSRKGCQHIEEDSRGIYNVPGWPYISSELYYYYYHSLQEFLFSTSSLLPSASAFPSRTSDIRCIPHPYYPLVTLRYVLCFFFCFGNKLVVFLIGLTFANVVFAQTRRTLHVDLGVSIYDRSPFSPVNYSLIIT